LGGSREAWNFADQNLDSSRFYDAQLDYANFSRANLTNAAFSSADLSYANLRQANLTNASFDSPATPPYASLYQADLTGAVVKGAKFGTFGTMMYLLITPEQLYSTASYQSHDLTGIQLNGKVAGWNFASKNLTNARFEGGDVTGADFTGAVVQGTNFRATGFTPAQLYSTNSYVRRNLTGIKLSGDLAGWNFAQQNLTNASFEFASLAGANLTDAIVQGANFSYSGITTAQLYSTASYQSHDLTGIRLGGDNLTSWNFAGQNLTNASFRGATLAGADFTDALVQGADFSYSDFTTAQLYSTASYLSHNLTGIGLGYHDLSGVNLSGQNLTNANFYSANLTGADLAGAIVEGTNLGGVTGFTAAQLYSTASYVARDLARILLWGVDITGWNLAQQNLTMSLFDGAPKTGADFSGADTRGALYLDLSTTVASNTIHPDGHIGGLDLDAGQVLVVRNYRGDPNFISPYTGELTPLSPIPVRIDEHFSLGPGGTLQLLLDNDPWDSLILFTAGIPVTLGGGTLDLQFAAGVDAASQIGGTFHVFDWTGVSPMGAFNVTSPFVWDLSNLYTTGEITFLAAAGLPGDFNGDGTVDAADYVVWHKGLGTTYTQAAYDVWRTYFGQPAGICAAIGMSSAAVPESATARMAIIVGIFAVCTRRRAAKPSTRSHVILIRTAARVELSSCN
jgi:uncharacterized protein YjbI with pentapeptide repeats